MRKLLPWVVLAFVVWFVVRNPTGAASTVRHLGDRAAGFADALARFASALSGGG